MKFHGAQLAAPTYEFHGKNMCFFYAYIFTNGSEHDTNWGGTQINLLVQFSILFQTLAPKS